MGKQCDLTAFECGMIVGARSRGTSNRKIAEFVKCSRAAVVKNQSERFVFITEWYDPNASLFRRYELLYYPGDGSVEMHDVKNRRTFLKRTRYDGLHLEDLFIGNKVNVFSRQLVLVDYGDQYTARQLGSRKEKTLALIKPDAVSKAGEIIEIINKAGFTITKLKMMMLSRKEAADFHIDHHSKPFFNELIQFITSGPVIAMEILRDDAICEWKRLLGPANSVVARADAPGSIRALFGADGIRNAAHGPDSFACAARELDVADHQVVAWNMAGIGDAVLAVGGSGGAASPNGLTRARLQQGVGLEMELFFPSSGVCGPANSAKFTNCTCCIIKPHAISEGMLGKILMAIRDAGFEISAMQMFNMDRANVEEFYEVYKGVVSEYNEMVTEIYSGPCVALEILQTNPAKTFRELCGPADPEIARHLRPGTLRAVFGKSKIQNAVHCTDLPEDGLLEDAGDLGNEVHRDAVVSELDDTGEGLQVGALREDH
ncbi:Nucleoside diphosphate kinase 7 [Myotis davidii]|uniref:Nucleoside diphosphate kinase homolog 7 n=1 Tax=Myotis davidii TaxID=225400 RepID=L5LUW4_MYODS|nr:Nucleoside diphosphate kinase 7 [Myotis davidii]